MPHAIPAALGRKTSEVSWRNGVRHAIESSYDAKGHRTGVAADGWTTTYHYNPFGGLTIGASVTFSANRYADAATGYVASLLQHEFGHTLQFAILSVGRDPWGAYLGTGALGITPLGKWGENLASGIGSSVYHPEAPVP